MRPTTDRFALEGPGYGAYGRLNWYRDNHDFEVFLNASLLEGEFDDPLVFDLVNNEIGGQEFRETVTDDDITSNIYELGFRYLRRLNGVLHLLPQLLDALLIVGIIG